MSRQVEVLPAAARDLEEARTWYEEQCSGLGEELVAEVDKTLKSVSDRPELHAVGFKGVRQALVDRFPYVVFFRIHDESIRVLAVLHAKRNPRVWRSRA
jgi:toxin ParE1/3/4